MSLDEQATTTDRNNVVALLASRRPLAARVDNLTRQCERFKQQLFGTKFERQLVGPDNRQLAHSEWRSAEAPGREITLAEHRRCTRPARSEEHADEDAARFDDSAPVEKIRLAHPPIVEEHDVISEKTTYRLAQKPASYVLLRDIRPVVERSKARLDKQRIDGEPIRVDAYADWRLTFTSDPDGLPLEIDESPLTD
jgi:transposase